ncbi:MAG: TIR domain-containing protein, partial [Cyanobacteria bacterium P01_D01_bin.56]
MTPFSDAFISYGRVDSKGFVTHLAEKLAAQGLDVWVDFEDIPLGVDYQEFINEGIDKSDNFLYVISPHSVNSKYCALELELAIKHNKRIIPLMQVEEISKDIWQQRYPQHTDFDWQDYTAAGKHSSHIHLHPLVSKINWVYFRGQDDFASSFQGLLELIESQKSHIRFHTKLLAQALAWERHQKKTQYLLFGEERHHAEQWLIHAARAEQASCLPNDLQCEFINASTKNANNLMTQVFIAYADQDKHIAEKIRRGLLRLGITVWNNTHDIETGQDFQAAINHGIESADNLIFLLSPEALRSSYCQHELDYAQHLNKRIIPILTRTVDVQDMPPSLQSLQYIDLADNINDHDYSQDERKILRVLHREETYYRDHKVLLVKSLKWKRQQHNPGILLRGYDLRTAEAWLKTAKRRTNNLPTQLQIEFIEESLRQPPEASLDVFISYSRSDGEFARKLNNELQKHGKKTWFDQESISAGTQDFEQEIYHGIEKSNNFIFVISPRAITSPYCDREVAYAAQLNKRFITVLYREISSNPLHPELAKIQWIDFSQSSENFYTGFNQMIRVLETDRDHVQHHTNISLQALQWEQKNQSPDLLIRGGELEAAQHWQQEAQAQQKQPLPTDLQINYLDACQKFQQATLKKEQRQQKFTQVLLGLMTIAFLGTMGLSIYAISQTRRAKTALRGQISLLSNQSHALVKNNQELDALVQATHAGQLLTDLGNTNPNLQEDVTNALQESLAWIKTRNRDKAHDNEITGIAIHPNERVLATASYDDNVHIWDSSGYLLHTLQHNMGVAMLRFTADGRYLITQSLDDVIHVWTTDWEPKLKISYEASEEDDIWSLDVSPNSQWVAIGTKKGQLNIWEIETGKLITSFSHGLAIGGVRFSPDSVSLVSWDTQNTFKLWSKEGKLQKTFKHSMLWDVLFSPDGQTLATRSENGTVKIWSSSGEEINTLDLGTSVYEFAFSQDSQFLAAGTSSGLLKLIPVKETKQPQAFQENATSNVPFIAHEGKINSIRFSPDNKTLITAGSDQMVKVWGLNGQELHRLKHQSEVWEAQPSPINGRWIASYDNEQLLRIWDLTQQTATRLKSHHQLTPRVNFSPNEQTIGTSSQDGQLNLWNRQGILLSTLTQESAALNDFQFSSDGQRILTGGADMTAKLFDKDGQVLRVFQHDASVRQVRFSPNNQFMATWQADGLVKLWSLGGKLLTTLIEQYSPSFSSNGELLITAKAGNLTLWDINEQDTSLNERCILQGPSELQIIFKYNLAPNEETIFTANDDGTARQWDLTCEQVMVFAHGNKNVDVR